ncbi:hypothetical protein F4808DRAFT_272020 [Astrocystis sublimbata]|nr:hypothetical protein F4808DRAFT_272020 [Astrocystis sublimbata]
MGQPWELLLVASSGCSLALSMLPRDDTWRREVPPSRDPHQQLGVIPRFPLYLGTSPCRLLLCWLLCWLGLGFRVPFSHFPSLHPAPSAICRPTRACPGLLHPSRCIICFCFFCFIWFCHGCSCSPVEPVLPASFIPQPSHSPLLQAYFPLVRQPGELLQLGSAIPSTTIPDHLTFGPLSSATT